MNAHDTERMSRRSGRLNTLTLRLNADLLDALHEDEKQRNDGKPESWYSLSLSADCWLTMEGHDLMMAEATIAMQDATFREKVRDILRNAQRLLDGHSTLEQDVQVATNALFRHFQAGTLTSMSFVDGNVVSERWIEL